MRLFHFLVAVIVAIPDAEAYEAHIKLPNGLPDGSVVTVHFYHAGVDGTGFTVPENPVAINFYDVETLRKDTIYDITAHLRIDRENTYPVKSNTYAGGRWLTETTREQPVDRRPWHKGWWRIDMYKHDKYHLNVFFQGFWSDVRSFEKSLDDVKSIYVISDYIGDPVKIHVRLPNYNFAPISVKEVYTFMNAQPVNYSKLVRIPHFAIGAQMNITAVLRGSGGAKHLKPTLLFSPIDGPSFFMKVVQFWSRTDRVADNIWEWSHHTHELYITSDDFPQPANENRRAWSESNLCNDWYNGQNGDLVHLTLHRTSENVVKMHVLYNNNYCQVKIPTDLTKYMDRPFDIISVDGALILHIEHNLPPVNMIRND